MKSVTFAICVSSIVLGIVTESGLHRTTSVTPATAPLLRPNHGEKEISPREIGHRSFLSPHASPIASDGESVYVVNTPGGTLDFIDIGTRKVVHRTRVGIEPVSLAIRPDGKEIWVANHISLSVWRFARMAKRYG